MPQLDEIVMQSKNDRQIKVWRLSVSDAVRLYLGDATQYLNSILQKGASLHKQNGYDNKRLFERYVYIGSNEYVLIRGVPDRIELPFVVEFKSCTLKTLHDVEKYAELQLQLYMFLTGLLYGRLDIYLKDYKQLIVGYKIYEYDQQKVLKVLATAVKRLKELMGMNEYGKKETR